MTVFLNQINLAANTNTTLKTIGGSVTAEPFCLNFCNQNDTPIYVRWAISTSDTPTAAEWLGYNVTIEANGILERTSLMGVSNKKIVVWSDSANVSVAAYGYEVTV